MIFNFGDNMKNFFQPTWHVSKIKVIISIATQGSEILNGQKSTWEKTLFRVCISEPMAQHGEKIAYMSFTIFFVWTPGANKNFLHNCQGSPLDENFSCKISYFTYYLATLMFYNDDIFKNWIVLTWHVSIL